MNDSDTLPVDFLAEPELTVANELPANELPAKGKKRKRKTTPPSSNESQESSSSSENSTDEKDHRRSKKKRRKLRAKKPREVESTAPTRRVVVTTRDRDPPVVACGCSDRVKKLAESVNKIKAFLKANYCEICAKAGHTRETCRRRRKFNLD